LASAPDIPTVAETIPGFEASGWFAVYAPAKTPKPIIVKLNQLVNEVLSDPEVREKYSQLGAVPVGGSPEKLAEQVRAELVKWADLVRATGIKME
jgi:tripartite-type tricarboxylate transporter receptor subunit TctC